MINEEEAKTVRRIFKEFLGGKGTPLIAKGEKYDDSSFGSTTAVYSAS
ncbi:hypothetical protein GGQ84_000987 [Desulfitispora alkaliphila]